MYDIPEGFMNEAMKEVRHDLYSDLCCGGKRTDDHYFTVVADSIWGKYVAWKNQDAARGDYQVKVGDIAMGCRNRGIEYKVEESEILLKMENLSYRFSNSYYRSFGGPADCNGEFLGFGFNAYGINFSTRALFRFLSWFDKAVAPLREQITERINAYCQQFKRAQILQSSAPFIFEPGLEDLDYRYSFSADDEGEYLNVWLYFEGEHSRRMHVVRLTFPYSELIEDPQKVKNIVRAVSRDRTNYMYYRKWATDVSGSLEEYPDYSTTKSAGVCTSF